MWPDLSRVRLLCSERPPLEFPPNCLVRFRQYRSGAFVRDEAQSTFDAEDVVPQGRMPAGGVAMQVELRLELSSAFAREKAVLCQCTPNSAIGPGPGPGPSLGLSLGLSLHDIFGSESESMDDSCAYTNPPNPDPDPNPSSTLRYANAR